MVIPTAVQPLTGDRPTSGLSSFGFGGTNAHVVVRRAFLETPSSLRSCSVDPLTCLSNFSCVLLGPSKYLSFPALPCGSLRHWHLELVRVVAAPTCRSGEVSV